MTVRDAVAATLDKRAGVPTELREIALALADVLDDRGTAWKGSPPAKAPVAKELRATLAAIDAVCPPKVVSTLDDLASKRADRRSKSKVGDGAAKGDVGRKRGGRASS